jgi:hypothetical protein
MQRSHRIAAMFELKASSASKRTAGSRGVAQRLEARPARSPPANAARSLREPPADYGRFYLLRGETPSRPFREARVRPIPGGACAARRRGATSSPDVPRSRGTSRATRRRARRSWCRSGWRNARGVLDVDAPEKNWFGSEDRAVPRVRAGAPAARRLVGRLTPVGDQFSCLPLNPPRTRGRVRRGPGTPAVVPGSSRVHEPQALISRPTAELAHPRDQESRSCSSSGRLPVAQDPSLVRSLTKWKQRAPRRA